MMALPTYGCESAALGVVKRRTLCLSNRGGFAMTLFRIGGKGCLVLQAGRAFDVSESFLRMKILCDMIIV